MPDQLSGLWVRRMLVYGDPMVLDRWRWIASHLPTARSSVLDAGCGNGSIATNVGRLGHSVLGLSYSQRELQRSQHRNPYPNVHFEVQDLRTLSDRGDLYDRFDVVICTEVIEHVLDDQELMHGLAMALNIGGHLLLTTPNIDYRPLDGKAEPPYEAIEDGRHVRKGYDERRLRELAAGAGLDVTAIQYCSGDWSQRLTQWYRDLHKVIDARAASLLLTPLRFMPLVLNPAHRPPFSICMVAQRPSRDPSLPGNLASSNRQSAPSVPTSGETGVATDSMS